MRKDCETFALFIFINFLAVFAQGRTRAQLVIGSLINNMREPRFVSKLKFAFERV